MMSGAICFEFIQQGPRAKFFDAECGRGFDRRMKGSFNVHNLKLVANCEWAHTSTSDKHRQRKRRVIF